MRGLKAEAERAAAGWDRAAGDWQRWSLVLPLLAISMADLSLPPRPLPPTSTATRLIVRTVLTAAQSSEPALFILDLPPILGVQALAQLSHARVVRPVLRLGRWPHRHGVLPSGRLVQALIQFAPSTDVDLGTPAHIALLLDGERTRPVHRPRRDPRADNRYTIASDELPDVNALRFAGVQRVYDVQGSDRPSQETPSENPLARYTAARIPVIPLPILIPTTPQGSRS